MSRLFCPDYGALPTPRGYRPMHSWFADEKLRLTVFKDGPRYFPTAAAARQAAKDYVTGIINGRDRAEKIETPADPLEQEIADFLARREQAAAEERERIFGSEGPSMVYPGKGKAPVMVERKRRRAA